VPNGGKSHVASINLTLDLHHFLTLPKVSSKPDRIVLNEGLLIDCSKYIMMTNEHYLATLKQKLVIKEIAIQVEDA
jgi:hypothetical protein